MTFLLCAGAAAVMLTGTAAVSRPSGRPTDTIAQPRAMALRIATGR
ncbi:hypothetical protein [Kutzneria buriramensis]|nr:hypothetical protein [Kutzneria buriramensis]